jgi:transposase
LLKEAGLSYQKPLCSGTKADEDEQEEFHDKLKNVVRDGRHSSLYRLNL